jgi:general secretion pathway protein A
VFESFYGLKASPFQLNPDPTFFFGSKGHSSAFAHLKYGVYQGEGFIVITGEIGAGKTTLVRTLLQQLDAGQVVAANLVSTQLEADDLLRSVAVAFGVPVRGVPKAQLIGALEAFLTSLVPENRRALLIVDEAQNLSARALEELRMLSNFQIGTRALLQSFLVGQPELRSLLRGAAMQQLRQRIVSSYHLGPLLNADETRAYVEHRLRHAGWSGDPSFDDAVFPAIHLASGGIPRRINAVASRLLLYGYLEEKRRFDAQDARRVIDEMQTELGMDPVEVAPAAPAAPAPAVAAQPAAPAAAEGRPDAVVRPFAYASLVARLDRLEKGIQTLQDMVRSLAPPERRGTGKSPGRPEHGRTGS